MMTPVQAKRALQILRRTRCATAEDERTVTGLIEMMDALERFCCFTRIPFSEFEACEVCLKIKALHRIGDEACPTVTQGGKQVDYRGNRHFK